MAFDFGFNSNKQKSSTTQVSSIDDWLRKQQEANYGGAQGLMPTYSPTSAAQIGAQMNPYTDQVINRLYANADRGRQQALNLVGDQFDAAGAFGGGRQGVAEGVALGEFESGLNDKVAGLLYGGYQDAATRAQDENRYGYAYPLARQGLLNSTLAGITPTVTNTGTSKGKSSGWNFGFSGGKKGGGGSDEDTAAMIMQLLGG